MAFLFFRGHGAGSPVAFFYRSKFHNKEEKGMKKREAFRKLFIVLVAAVVLVGPVVLAGPAFATEGGGGAYPNGAEDFMAGALPPPGTYFKNYLLYYSASQFNDKNGNDLIPDFKLKAAAECAPVHPRDQLQDPRGQLGCSRLYPSGLPGRDARWPDRRPFRAGRHHRRPDHPRLALPEFPHHGGSRHLHSHGNL